VPETLILHWNGTAWTHAASPAPPSGALYTALQAVSADSATDAWAVGTYDNSSNANKPLLLHWNGTVWETVKGHAPTGATNTWLTAVSADSATGAWAAGYYFNASNVEKPLLLRWNGTAWKTVNSPAPSGAQQTQLNGVSADSATDGWAVGYYENSSGVDETLILHWNGTAWKKVKSPNGA
jgi:hypothetical protein